MKIVLATSEYHRGGGFPRNAAQIARSMTQRGHSVTVFSQRAVIEPEDAGIEFKSYRTPGWSKLASMFWEPHVLTKLFERVRGDFDICITVGMPCLAPVVLIGPGTHQAWYQITTSRDGGGGLIRRTFERVRPFHWAVMYWETRMLKKRTPRLVVVPSESGIREYRELFDFPRERLTVIPYPVEKEFTFSETRRREARARLGIADEVRMMLHIGNRGRQKGLDTVVQALKELETTEPWRFVFAGSGSSSAALDEATKSLRAQGKVTLLGRVEETLDLYCAADLLVFPSRFDPWGLVVTEALATGTPVVCSASIGAAIAVVEGVNGTLLKEATDHLALARIIDEMLARLGSFDRPTVSRSVDWLSHERQAELYERELEDLMARDVT